MPDVRPDLTERKALVDELRRLRSSVGTEEAAASRLLAHFTKRGWRPPPGWQLNGGTVAKGTETVSCWNDPAGDGSGGPDLTLAARVHALLVLDDRCQGGVEAELERQRARAEGLATDGA